MDWFLLYSKQIPDNSGIVILTDSNLIYLSALNSTTPDVCSCTAL